MIAASLGPIRHLTRERELSREYPEAEVRAMDAKWYRLVGFDSAVVSMNDGTSAALYKRDARRYRDLLRRTLEIHERLRREWPRLAAEYRAELGAVTSPESWEETFRPWTHGEDRT
jgi:galactofuranosylgalactofuranosylrhamnosyl-N-acetylglucosaminyl-diphospho-decaprenol beta-1,5/1,6-galactofuranosyltransferase